MVAVAGRRIRGSGTSEEEWLCSKGLAGLRAESFERVVSDVDRIVVCTPHPDDEILPCGGLLAEASDRGYPIRILALTDGEASHGSDRAVREMLRTCRPGETEAALGMARIRAEVPRFSLEDGGLPACGRALERRLAAEFRPTDLILVPWRFDGHPDHEAAARAAISAAKEAGSTLREMPIWGWHWAVPDRDDFPWSRAIRFDLTSDVYERKQAAVRCFESQLESAPGRPAILAESTLVRFRRPWEVFFR